jgi:hypothetical protein
MILHYASIALDYDPALFRIARDHDYFDICIVDSIVPDLDLIRSNRVVDQD